jgi:hypothetical protein
MEHFRTLISLIYYSFYNPWEPPPLLNSSQNRAPRPTPAPLLNSRFHLRLASAQFQYCDCLHLRSQLVTRFIMSVHSDDSMSEVSRVTEVCGDLFDAPEGSCLIRKLNFRLLILPD